jgi:N-acetylmuramoyl-L-alanine amidase
MISTRFHALSQRRLATRAVAAIACSFVLLVAAALFGQSGQSLQGPSSSPALTILSKDGRRTLQLAVVNDQELVALDDLAGLFQLTIQEESLGAITVSYKGKTILLTPEQALASVSGKLVSLPAPPTRSGRRWLVPVEFINRALAPIYDARLDLRKPSHLLIVGDLRVPRVTIRYEPLGPSSRMTVDASPRATSTVSQENERLAIRFDADALDVSLPPIVPQPGGNIVQALHVADPVTIAVDLGPRFGSFRASAQPVDASMRLVIDFVAASTETTTPQPASPTPAAPQAPGPPPQAPDLGSLAPSSSIRTIALDPGHGGDDEGTRGPGGTKEKDLALGVARRVRSVIEARLGVRVLLTRDDDRNVALNDRTAAANNNKADVFISLHANASWRKGTAGASISCIAFEEETAQAARASLTAERLPTFGGGLRDIELVPWDLAQIRYVDQSSELAKILEQTFRNRVPLAMRAVDRAPLRVLESANMPAVSIEMGFLSNPDQERQLTGGEFQGTLASAVVDAISRFREYLEAQRTTTAAGQAPRTAATAGVQR